ncbi:tumor necrosis factor ligand superfamily member 8 [Mantella aurantiaca]
MEPQDLASRELRAIKKTLCCIGSTACALCLVCTATTLVLLLGGRTRSNEESTQSEHQTQRQGNTTQPPYRTTAHAQLTWLPGEASSSLLWRSDGPGQGMTYQDGKLTILTKGLYFIHCQLHFYVNECLKRDEDVTTRLALNGRDVHQSIQTVQKQDRNSSECRIYTNQHLSLQIQLDAYDNVSVRTSHAHWLNDNGLTADSIVFGAFRI